MFSGFRIITTETPSLAGLDFMGMEVAQGQGQWTNLRLDDYDPSNEWSPRGHGNSVSNNKDSKNKCIFLANRRTTLERLKKTGMSYSHYVSPSLSLISSSFPWYLQLLDGRNPVNHLSQR